MTGYPQFVLGVVNQHAERETRVQSVRAVSPSNQGKLLVIDYLSRNYMGYFFIMFTKQVFFFVKYQANIYCLYILEICICFVFFFVRC